MRGIATACKRAKPKGTVEKMRIERKEGKKVCTVAVNCKSDTDCAWTNKNCEFVGRSHIFVNYHKFIIVVCSLFMGDFVHTSTNCLRFFSVLFALSSIPYHYTFYMCSCHMTFGNESSISWWSSNFSFFHSFNGVRWIWFEEWPRPLYKVTFLIFYGEYKRTHYLQTIEEWMNFWHFNTTIYKFTQMIILWNSRNAWVLATALYFPLIWKNCSGFVCVCFCVCRWFQLKLKIYCWMTDAYTINVFL